MIYSKIPLAQTLVQLSKSYGFSNVVISPGSRNAPLIIGFTENSYFKCYSVVDERCAAFFALGLAQQLAIPTILVCTSGSALLNYYPAIAEAYYSNIPLVVLSADRPDFLLNIGDGQTINQRNVFEDNIEYSTSLKLDISAEKGVKNSEQLPIFKSLENSVERFLGIQNGIQDYNEVEINTAYSIAINKQRPVHLNVPFNEPLYDTVDVQSVNPSLNRKRADTSQNFFQDLDVLIQSWNAATKKMIVIGVMKPNTIEQRLLQDLANDESVLIFTETTSNIHHDNVFPCIDKLISPLNHEEMSDLKPEILLTFGGMVVSKKIKAFLRNHEPIEHWHVGTDAALDTYFKLKKAIKISPNDFLKEFLIRISKDNSNYRIKWSLLNDKRDLLHKEYLNKIEFSDLLVFDLIQKSLPENSVLQLSNSTIIRYSQLFKLPKSIEVYCNRGTSGIDGSTSTAVGFAAASNKQTVLVTGDLSFFYDSNALWNNYISTNFRIIVINNGGGGIFRILPGEKSAPNFENFFETIHDLNAEHLCKMYGLVYLKACNEDELNDNLTGFYDVGHSPKLLEIFTPREKNDAILLRYFDFLK